MGLILLVAANAPGARGQVEVGQLQSQEARPQQPVTANSTPSPAEYQAFSSALSQGSPAEQAAALQSFLDSYPQSALAGQARRLLAINTARDRASRSGVARQGTIPGPALRPAAGTGVPERSSTNQPAVRPSATAGTPAASTPIGSAAAHRAVIDLAPHTLTIRADNSSLAQIFRDLSASTGLKVEGLAHDERIYGSFGPGDPHDVLTALINGLGYNFMMVGESSRGVPRQLILTTQAAQAQGEAQPASAPPAEMEQEEVVVQDDQMQPEVQEPGRSFMPPQIPAGQGPGANRTTQQMLDELRQMHPQQQDNPPQPPQTPQQ
ncbi:MAG TPA: hypothetical protein VGD64_15155 [Acidisarcina sp.]